ncbi:MAG: endonuclease MutS2 [Bacillota bacterium]|uniref:endonuclease MutS2 n=1 Tax=unclassified Virgibacillus TaxID=2620237 RepID=UPI000EF49042|nr:MULTISPECIES: endonuclease MutS2 [unclassified Virgibacillus]MCC2250344.1 endonuclease MutS2 [Virgibacillus sp. AGTR]MDY7044095.1 endonuclease MutS2 [Virgibacillus sp. M23]QRZ17638.1 endonuclease MutS2 [Virgibacillus sp. AGTR]
MNERIFRTLEFQKIIERLTSKAETTVGKDLSQKLEPSTNMDEVLQLQNETDEAMHIQRLDKTIPLGGIFDIRASLKRSVIGGVLSTNECMDVASTIYGGRRVKDFISKLEEAFPILKELVEHISPLRDLERHIKSCIDDHGHVMDSASQKLRGIRSSIRTNESRVREKLDSYTKTKSSMLSDAIITIRNDRYVLPVKQEYRGAIGGIVHDQSASGQTLFMEPKAVVDLNNQLQEAIMNEKQEIDRILRELSAHIANEEAFLQENVRVLGKIDFMFARAKLGQSMKAAKPNMNNNGIIKMQQARHPLIDINEVVANDIEIGESYTSIVITGPNTGGKTVTLKMIGLCTLMAQSGLQIPALDGCELAVFKHVFADIGDEQSIEQNLSTFSSHMTNIVDILQHVDDQTLVLFDELGAGTDPQEGAALAMAILDEVIARNARVIATTHYPELKAYGYNREHVVNASVEFDVQTLQPTYRLLLGVPGRSNAFEISRRIGLSNHVIEQAQGHVGVDSKSVENMIASLEKSQINTEKDYAKAHELLQEATDLHHDLQRAWAEFEEKREGLYERAEEKADKAIKQAREEAEMIVSEIRNMRTEAEWKEHEWIEARKMLDSAKPNLTTKEKQQPKEKKGKKELRSGDEIKLLTINQKGTVLEKVNDKEYLVQVGIMKVKVDRNDLQFIGKQNQTIEKPLTTIKGSNYHVKTELDLRGERFEDALLRLEKYIDDALLAGYPKVSIIHGKGTGALRKGVLEFVKKHPRISDARPGEAGEGGSGVTIINLK